MTTISRFPLLLATLTCSVLLVAGGCTKKTVLTPQKTNKGIQQVEQNDPYTETEIETTMDNGGFSENNIPTAGTLDDSNYTEQVVTFDQQSDQYKMTYGRCSQGLKPIFFDFDSSTIKPDMVQTIQNNAEILKQRPNSYVFIEGNTDEKGTNEYNLALGERRAQNTKKYLMELGIDPRRLRTISYGEERPLFFETTETAYSYNRRVDFVVK